MRGDARRRTHDCGAVDGDQARRGVDGFECELLRARADGLASVDYVRGAQGWEDFSVDGVRVEERGW